MIVPCPPDPGDAMFGLITLTSVLFAAPVPATGKAPDPVLTLQFAPAAVLEKDVFRLLESMPFPDKEAGVKQVRDQLRAILGDQGWDGLDTAKPSTGYVVFDDKNTEKSYGFLVLPVKDEKSFLDFLARVGKGMDPGNTIEPVAAAPGVYELKGKNKDVPKHVRVHNGYAYLGINAPIDAFAADRLVPAEKMINPKETAKAAATVHVNRIPKSLIDKALAEFDKAAADAKRDFPPSTPNTMKAAYDKATDLARNYAEMLRTDGDSFGLRVRYDEDLTYEFYLKGKPGTKLTGDIAGRAPTVNRFGGLITDTAVGGFTIKLPFFNDDVRALSATTATDLYKELCEKDPPPADLKPLFDKLAPAIASTIRSGQADLAGALHGPDAKGAYTAVLGVALDGADGLLPEVKKLIDSKAEGTVEWDANEAGGVKIHTANVGPLMPAPGQPAFGKNPTCHFALTKGGLVLAFGRDSLNEVKRAVALKPVAGPVIDFRANPAKVVTMTEAFDAGAGAMARTMIGKTDRLVSFNAVRVTGGDELRVTFNTGMTLFGGVFTARSVPGP
jgi:hypothetical protein